MGQVRVSSSRIQPNENFLSCAKDKLNVRTCVNFQKLWDGHPLNWNPRETAPFKSKDGTPLFQDQCAIKMSIALQQAGVPLATFKGATASSPVLQLGVKPVKAALRAEELAQWLIKVLGQPDKYTAAVAIEAVKFRNGIVFFKDFWARDLPNGGQESGINRSGDHIDVWDGHTIPSMPTVNTSQFANPLGGWSHYFKNAKAVWLWEIK